MGSKGDSYDNALAEALNSLYKAELIRNQGPWEDIDAVEVATAEWVHWFNNTAPIPPSACIASSSTSTPAPHRKTTLTTPAPLPTLKSPTNPSRQPPEPDKPASAEPGS